MGDASERARPPVPGLRGIERRRVTPERMDDPGLDPAVHEHALRGLARINAISRADAAIWRVVRPVLKRIRKQGRTATLLDVASGSGDVPLKVARRAQRRGVPLELDLTDISKHALELAQRRARALNVEARTFVWDALREPPRERYDVVTCSLFLHHLEAEQIVAVLRAMREAARERLVVHDLRRTRMGYLAAWIGSHLLSSSPVVHEDAVRSVAAGFTAGELKKLAKRAGLNGARVGMAFPWRLLLTWDVAAR